MSKQLFLITPNLANGGAERVTAILANALADEGYDTSAVFMKDDLMAYSLSEKVGVVKCFGSGRTVMRIVGKIMALRRLIKSNRQGVFIAMLPYESVYLFIAGIACKCKKIYSMRNDPSRLTGIVNSFVKKVVYPWGDRIVFQTPDAMAYFPKKVREKSVVIANPINADLPAPFTGTREKAFVTAGRFTEQKNYPLLLNAFAEFHQQYPDWQLRIYGKGKLEPQLRILCRELGIKDQVVFCGFSEHLPEDMNQCSAFILASDYEGISNAMLEALGSGVPCICTDCPIGGARMFINNGENGILVPVGEKETLADAMRYAVQNPGAMNEMANNALKIKEKFSTVNVTKEWIGIL